jgi:tetratricopeptide (TPR) repeat protein
VKINFISNILVNRAFYPILFRMKGLYKLFGRATIEIRELRLLAERGRWIELEAKGRKVLSNKPKQEEVMALLSFSLQQQARLEEAVILATQAVALQPTRWLSNFIAGVSLIELGREREAIAYLRQAIALSPNDFQTLKQLIKAISTSDGIEIAATEYSKHRIPIAKRSDIVIATVSSVRDWAQKIGLPLLEIFNIEKIPFKAPNVWGMDSASEVRFALSNKPYVADITNARIFSNSSIILTADGTALCDNAGDPKFGTYVSFVYDKVVVAKQSNKVLLNFSDYKTHKIDAGIYLSGLASNHFGHWLPEFLPKLQFLKKHPDFASLPIIVDKDMPQSHFDHLRRLVENPLILLPANESFLCKRLLVAPTPAFSPVELYPNDIPVHEMPGLSPRALRFLQGNKLHHTNKPHNRRIFLARKKMKWRRLLNEDDIAEYLFKLGFEKIFIEEMTVSEQIDLFQQAQWIVAPNGSSLLNIIFADKKVKLLVLCQPNLFNWGTFQGPMEALGYQSTCLRGEYAINRDYKHSDYSVSLKHMRLALAEMGMNVTKTNA